MKQKSSLFATIGSLLKAWQKFKAGVMMLGAFLIAVGVIVLLQNLGVISADVWGIIWPSLLILFGIWLITRVSMMGK